MAAKNGNFQFHCQCQSLDDSQYSTQQKPSQFLGCMGRIKLQLFKPFIGETVTHFTFGYFVWALRQNSGNAWDNMCHTQSQEFLSNIYIYDILFKLGETCVLLMVKLASQLCRKCSTVPMKRRCHIWPCSKWITIHSPHTLKIKIKYIWNCMQSHLAFIWS